MNIYQQISQYFIGEVYSYNQYLGLQQEWNLLTSPLLMADPFLRKHLLLSPIPSQPASIHFHVNHFISQSSEIIDEQIVINYPSDYPKNPPSISVLTDQKANVQIPQIVTQCLQILPQNWKQTTKIKDILIKLIKSLDFYWENIYGYGKSYKINNIKCQKNKNLGQKQKVAVQTNYQIQPHNLALLNRLEQIAYDLYSTNFENAYICLLIINEYKKNAMKIQDVINKLFKVDQFRQQLKRQLRNGQWINKILKCTSGMIYKKYLLSLISELAAKISEFQNYNNQINDNKDSKQNQI